MCFLLRFAREARFCVAGVMRQIVPEDATLRPVVSDFELQFSPAQIEPLAKRFAYADDSGPCSAGAAARARGHYTRDEFLTVCRWKTRRTRSKVEANHTASILSATVAAFSTTDESRRMEALLALDGVGVPTASALLHFAFPSDYPILDVRALESLGRRGRTEYSVSFWVSYLSSCRQLADSSGVSIRTLDKALWQHSKERDT